MNFLQCELFIGTFNIRFLNYNFTKETIIEYAINKPKSSAFQVLRKIIIQEKTTLFFDTIYNDPIQNPSTYNRAISFNFNLIKDCVSYGIDVSKPDSRILDFGPALCDRTFNYSKKPPLWIFTKLFTLNFCLCF